MLLVSQVITPGAAYRLLASNVTPIVITKSTLSTPSAIPNVQEIFQHYYMYMVILTIITVAKAFIRLIYGASYLIIRHPTIMQKFRISCAPIQRVHSVRLYIKIWSEQDVCLLYLTNVNHEPHLTAFTLAPIS